LIPERVPVDEDAPLLPLHPYGVSKVAQDLLAFQYWQGHRIRTIRARIFNTTGPRKQNDVVSDFAARVARIAADNGAGDLSVGNLESRRTILDVRDLVSALRLLFEGGRDGEAYNICGDTVYRIGELIPLFEAAAGIRLNIAPNPQLLRPTDEPIIAGSAARLKLETGWRQMIPIETTVRDTFNHEMSRLARRTKSGLWRPCDD
jgi:GDP-4-dehydro-6-deoxy-D-mannose reductase